MNNTVYLLIGVASLLAIILGIKRRAWALVVLVIGVNIWLGGKAVHNDTSPSRTLSAADRLATAYRTCRASNSADVVHSHLSYQGGAITIWVGTTDDAVLLRCITHAAGGAPEEFFNQLGQTTATTGQGSDSFNGIAATWSYENPSGQVGFLNIQLYPAA